MQVRLELEELAQRRVGDVASGLDRDSVDRRVGPRATGELGSEHHAAHTLHEAIRYDHSGRCYKVDSPTARRVA